MAANTGEWRPYVTPGLKLSAYAHWWLEHNEPAEMAGRGGGGMRLLASTAAILGIEWDADKIKNDNTMVPLSLRDPETRKFTIRKFPILPIGLQDSLNPDKQTTFGNPEDWLPDSERLPQAKGIEAIVGIIDIDIPLAHRCLRNREGGSRVLASWQMEHVFEQKGYLPYGREIYRDQIDELLKKHSGGRLLGRSDEDAFNRELGLVDMKAPFGPRGLAGRFAHGSHVIDLAAGCNPETEPEFSEKVGIISVTLPGRWLFGDSGEFLELFMVVALQRIADLSDAFWRRNHPEAKPGAKSGYPTVVNLSFGRQAGAKSDQIDQLPKFLACLQKERRDEKKSQFQVVMPAGNDNQSRVNAEYHIAPGQQCVVGWRLQPGDQSDNYVEIWARNAKKTVPELAIAIAAPSGEADPTIGEPGTAFDVRSGVRVYRLHGEDIAARGRLSYLVCTCPTESQRRPYDVVPSGLWRIVLRNCGKTHCRVRLSIQTDQSVLPAGGLGRRSYFDDSTYVRFDECGREPDGSRFDGKTWVVSDNRWGTTRHGTLNASVAHKKVSTVGGYRLSDGAPAPYSSTGVGLRGKGSAEVEYPRRAPTASLPSEDGIAHPGLLAAGASDGVRVPVSGTSFASALATRRVAQGFLATLSSGDGSQKPKTSSSYLYPSATRDERKARFGPPYTVLENALIDRLGGGRIRHPKPGPVPRFGHR
ncbi:hypothetical protein [Sedimentitalea sp.]|uniref:hypothetical protein n=1 Tax=Sedimentitalea sp. TaxID=2048915 RepID=UPI0032984D92